MRQIHRWNMPVDGGPLEIRAPWVNGVSRVEAANDGMVEFWAEIDTAEPETDRSFVVIGTGHKIPDYWVHVGTTGRTEQGMIWHLLTSRKAQT